MRSDFFLHKLMDDGGLCPEISRRVLSKCTSEDANANHGN